MNNVLFRRGDQTFIDENVPLNDGQIIFNETDEAIYVDTTIDGTVTRKRYGGGNLSRSDIDMALSTISENPVANKVLTELMLQKADVIDDLGTALAVTENGVPTGCKTIQGLNTKINTTQAQVSNSNDAYSVSKAYAIGNLCIYNNILYRCTTPCSAGSWEANQSCFAQDTLTNALSDFVKIVYVNANFNNGFTTIQGISGYVFVQCGISTWWITRVSVNHVTNQILLAASNYDGTTPIPNGAYDLKLIFVRG